VPTLTADDTIEPVSRLVRALLCAVIVLVALIGIPLNLLSASTDSSFAWTINPPLEAAFIGSGYWAVLVASVLGLSEPDWRRLRALGLAATFVTTTITIVTLIHLDRFHLGADAALPRAVAWIWLAVYLVVPPLLIVAVARQMWTGWRTLPSGSTRQDSRLPPLLRWLLVGLGIALVLVGGLLLLAPGTLPWAWPLTPLTSRVSGAFIAALAITALIVSIENNADRTRLAAVTMIAFVVLQAITLIRFASDVTGSAGAVAMYVVILAAAGVLGGWALLTGSHGVGVAAAD
jgi:hypothetical protein